MWLMKKSRKVVSVSTSMKDECISLPKPKSQLAQLHDDDDDVFATSLIDRHAARPPALQNICLATFAVMYECNSIINKERTENVNAEEEMQNAENDNSLTKINCEKDWVLLGRGNRIQYYIQEGTKSVQNQKKYYHSKVLLYYLWNPEDDIISIYTTYHTLCMSKQDIIHQNAQKFSEEFVAFDVDLQDL